MRVYFDPSLLVALYLPEHRTGMLRQWLVHQRPRIGLNVWQELEFRNAARQKVLRGEAGENDLARTFRIFQDDWIAGRLVQRRVQWERTFAEAERISQKFSIGITCRSFDLIHVAIARASSIREFATLDTDQARLAKAAGLMVVELPE
jgi:predicted nucleic acid-binding protein